MPAISVVIDQANEIIAAYAAQGFDLTLRQLYYQFVSRDRIANSDREYKRLGSVINDAQLAGLVDWDAITDRTRNVRAVSHWETPGAIIDSAAYSFRIDKWLLQPYRVEVWIEKDALAGVIERVCTDLDVPYFSCRGYTSQSEMWAAAHNVEAVTVAYAAGEPAAITFSNPTRLGVQTYRLPANIDAIERLLARMPRARRTRMQATRVAWRIIKDWIEAQLAIVQAGMVPLDQVMLPYMETSPNGPLLYDAYLAHGLKLRGDGR